MQDQIEIEGSQYPTQDVIRAIEPMLQASRVAKIERVLESRSLALVPVLEGIYDMGNASAVFRSAEALGFFEMCMIETQTKFKIANRVSSGADKWLRFSRYNSTRIAFEALKKRGYQVVVTHMDASSEPIEAFDFTQKTALVFGNERDGVSQDAIDLADRKLIIPMQGFVQSFNISVAAAIALSYAYFDRVRRLGKSGDLSELERLKLKAEYYLKHVTHPKEIIERFKGGI